MSYRGLIALAASNFKSAYFFVHHDFAGYAWESGFGAWSLRIPLWHVLLLTLMVPVTHAIHIRKTRLRRTNNCCLKCGYDLRASPSRCPECGAIPEAPS
jgi:hypothetical protein